MCATEAAFSQCCEFLWHAPGYGEHRKGTLGCWSVKLVKTVREHVYLSPSVSRWPFNTETQPKPEAKQAKVPHPIASTPKLTGNECVPSQVEENQCGLRVCEEWRGSMRRSITQRRWNEQVDEFERIANNTETHCWRRLILQTEIGLEQQKREGDDTRGASGSRHKNISFLCAGNLPFRAKSITFS